MSGVTNRVGLEELLPIIGEARACVSWVVDHRPHVEPAAVRHLDPGFEVSVGGTAPEVGTGVVVVVDEGVQFFDLRAVYVRGSVTGRVTDRRFEVVPDRVTCWDYGRLRVDDGPL